MKRIMISLISALLLLLAVPSQQLVRANSPQNHQAYQECDLWAREHNECKNNPRFMWASCIASCIKYSKNDHPYCNRWAAEGECSNNPDFVQIHCPESCSFAVVWDYWMRRNLNIDNYPLNVTYVDEFERASLPAGLFGAAEVLRRRLDLFVQGFAPVVRGFNTRAPTHFLGMVGLVEAVLYTLRLYEVTLYHSNQYHYHLDALRVKIRAISDFLREVNYNGDKLMLNIPRYMTFLQDTADFVEQALRDEYRQEHPENSEEVRLSILGKKQPLHLIANYFLETRHEFTYLSLEQQHASEPVSMVSTTPSSFSLANGVSMPTIGLGTWQLDGAVCREAVLQALQNGYKWIDTAQAYGNEAEVGAAIAEAIERKIIRSRREIFIATKISFDESYGYQQTRELVRRQLEDLRTDYIDLYMLHSPFKNKDLEKETWRALEDLHEEKVILALGLSNFDTFELKNILEHTVTKFKPLVLQNKLDIYHVGKQLDSQGDAIIELAQKENIIVTSYSPFSAFPFVLEAAHDPIVEQIAQRKEFLLNYDLIHSEFFQEQQRREQSKNTVKTIHQHRVLGPVLHLTDEEIEAYEESHKRKLNANAESFRPYQRVTSSQIILKWMLQRGFTVIPRSSDPARQLENLQAVNVPDLTLQEMDVLDSIQLLTSHSLSVPIIAQRK